MIDHHQLELFIKIHYGFEKKTKGKNKQFAKNLKYLA